MGYYYIYLTHYKEYVVLFPEGTELRSSSESEMMDKVIAIGDDFAIDLVGYGHPEEMTGKEKIAFMEEAYRDSDNIEDIGWYF